MLLKGILPKLHPHLFLALVLVKVASIGVIVASRYRAKARKSAMPLPADIASDHRNHRPL